MEKHACLLRRKVYEITELPYPTCNLNDYSYVCPDCKKNYVHYSGYTCTDVILKQMREELLQLKRQQFEEVMNNLNVEDLFYIEIDDGAGQILTNNFLSLGKERTELGKWYDEYWDFLKKINEEAVKEYKDKLDKKRSK